MEDKDLSISDVKARSVRGVVVLTGRTVILQVVTLVAQLLLFAYLGVSEFGVFAIVSAVVNFLTYFSDIGLAAALIQKKETPSDTDLKTTFTVQQCLILFLVLILFIVSPLITNHYSLSTGGQWLMYALGFSLIISSLKSIPSVLLERKLEFVKLVFPQILETFVYNIVLVVFAMKGFGITSFTVAVIIRSLVGLTVIYWIQPWKPGFSFSLSTLKDLFKFGVPYQINTLLATFKDDGMTLILGGIIGPAGIGILSFAQKVARLPLTFFMDTVTKVTFPAFSRLQTEKDHLERSVTRSIFFICLLVFPSLVGIVILMPWVVELVPKYNKWVVALTPLLFISINYAFASATTQLTNLLNAIGKIKITFYLMIMWTTLTWVLIPFLAIKFGVNGAAVGYSLVGLSSVVAVYIAKKYVNFSISDSMIKPLMASIIMFVTLVFVRKFLDVSFYSLGILVLVGVISYSASIISMVGSSLLEDVKKSLKTIFNRN
ncbi:MAG: Polysaccharide biosynthesis protein [Candidatus Woesebacteria bacterium GW2011_GWA1_33_30]|uniref:Polysaccharide biosynthesis protein n=1 Tax=Candidatus Woesebacteria bacterium GW2011_GWA2_33_28 TaxID=1618561 RepID=A0A0F9ZVN4_9BACT|nr:MAG: Polysaccharide biosynthesis protein [Candidatus Woesebacteria bacterium GW2011_GWA2_33_28]KKP49046.1 MAG: Polysaccharide biosynthesis protein [Candidatus Woesebacteria bacterium GW2011_GWA1_33_30]KKP49846.1 MAG: Polysaccharide biosynthesis protein [Microgenomates group bacterium GW2011_GWC1_33_32]KKP52638.1 MAG: Polysaccharide biosynthesis protein [Candidatus Woesebacteria bacterium GW2011_GWB1_33_38]KKP58815.1 MAG: Polysaccharide biosynthesis protein [Microgenomates group bacterium GW2